MNGRTCEIVILAWMIMFCAGCEGNRPTRLVAYDEILRADLDPRTHGWVASILAEAPSGALVTVVRSPVPGTIVYVRQWDGRAVRCDEHVLGSGPGKMLYVVPFEHEPGMLQNLRMQVKCGFDYRCSSGVADAPRIYDFVLERDCPATITEGGHVHVVEGIADVRYWKSELAVQVMKLSMLADDSFPSFATYVRWGIACFDEACMLAAPNAEQVQSEQVQDSH
jgi:hypothetical protein